MKYDIHSLLVDAQNYYQNKNTNFNQFYNS